MQPYFFFAIFIITERYRQRHWQTNLWDQAAEQVHQEETRVEDCWKWPTPRVPWVPVCVAAAVESNENWGWDDEVTSVQRFHVAIPCTRHHSLQKYYDKYISCSCSLAVLDPRVGHTMDVLSPFIPVLCHSDWLFHGESCPRLDVVHPGRAWPSSPSCTWHCSFLALSLSPGNSLVSSWCDHSMLASLLWRWLTVPSFKCAECS